MDTITYGEISPRVGIKAVARLLMVGQPLLVTQRFAQQESMKRNSGDTVKWRRYNKFVVSKAPLAEGVPPALQGLTKTDYTAVLRQYGAVAKLTDVVMDLHEDNILSVLIDRSGEQMAETIEAVTIDVLKAGTTVVYANGAANRLAVNSPVLRGDFRLVQRGFDRNSARMISSVIAPSGLISTMGVEAGYFAMGHTDLDPDIRTITGFKSYVEYGDPMKRLPGEVGAVGQFRIILTNMFSPWTASGLTGTTYLSGGAKVSVTALCDVYPIICVARDAYGVVRLQTTGADQNNGKSPVGVKVLQPKPRGGDPLGQSGSVGWIAYFACAILSEQWLARIECACTASPS